VSVPARKVAAAWVARRARQDIENLRPALEIYAALLKAVVAGRGMDVYPADERVVLQASTLNLRDFRKATERLWFEFEAGGGIFYDANRQRIHIRTLLRVDDLNYKLLVKRAVEKNKKQIVHELTHHLDYLRMGGGWDEAERSYKTPEEDAEAYYNHPLEMNAYFQMGASPVVEEYQTLLADLEKDTGPDNEGSGAHQMAVWSLSDMAGSTWDGFLKDWVRGQTDKGKFWENLTPKNRKRMQKRVYDLFDKTVLDAKRKLEELKRRGDPMAVMT